MLIRQFLTWAERASAGARADAACALARAYLYADLDPVDLGEAERALTSLLDDPSPLVRRALAEAFATAVDAPHHVVVALASDQSDIASLVLERSPVLGDADPDRCRRDRRLRGAMQRRKTALAVGRGGRRTG